MPAFDPVRDAVLNSPQERSPTLHRRATHLSVLLNADDNALAALEPVVAPGPAQRAPPLSDDLALYLAPAKLHIAVGGNIDTRRLARWGYDSFPEIGVADARAYTLALLHAQAAVEAREPALSAEPAALE